MISHNDTEWLKCKRYLHLDLPIEGAQRNRVLHYVQNPDTVAKHPFLPLIRRIVSTYRHAQKDGKRVCKVKKRKLTYASHLDAAIFSYYAYDLQKKYEEYLRKHDLTDVVTAYRKIPCKSHAGNKSNIDFACDIFTYIKERLKKEREVAVITFDIQSFFDNLNHKILKNNWKRILGVDSFSKDQYNVFKNVVNYAYVDDLAVFNLFKSQILCQQKHGNIIKHKVINKSYLRDQGALAYCLKNNIKDIRDKGLIRTHKKESTHDVGIPQGLPISAVLANLYLMDFDLEVNQKMAECNAIYRRYSDDIIVVCPQERGEKIKCWIQKKIRDVHLEIQEKKTHLYRISVSEHGTKCEHSLEGTKKKLEYLGFSFDGETVLLKNASVGKFYNKMHKAIFRSVHFACSINNATKGIIFERHLISQFTYAGSKSHRIYKRSKTSKRFYTLPAMKSYGNYLTYVRKSAEVMGEPKIARQLRRCTNKLSKSIKWAKEQAQRKAFMLVCVLCILYNT